MKEARKEEKADRKLAGGKELKAVKASTKNGPRIRPRVPRKILGSKAILRGGGGREEGGSVRIDPSQQLLDDHTNKRKNKRKVGKPIYN